MEKISSPKWPFSKFSMEGGVKTQNLTKMADFVEIYLNFSVESNDFRIERDWNNNKIDITTGLRSPCVFNWTKSAKKTG